MTPAEILDGAADYIEEYGWTQGPESSSVPGCPTCAGIAIDLAAKDGDEVVPEWFAAVDFLRGVVGASRFGAGGVIDWNDAPGRTQAEVVTALRTAADNARKAEQEGTP